MQKLLIPQPSKRKAKLEEILARCEVASYRPFLQEQIDLLHRQILIEGHDAKVAAVEPIYKQFPRMYGACKGGVSSCAGAFSLQQCRTLFITACSTTQTRTKHA